MDQRIAAKSSKLFFARLRSVGNEGVANILKCSEGTVSELSGKDKYKFNFNSVCELLARFGLKIVPSEYKCYNPEDIDRILYLARKGMESMSADSLEWDGEAAE